MTAKPKCTGPVYFADQGIECCETCGGCICCDHEDVDHGEARYRCLPMRDGRCGLVNSKLNHDCARDAWPATTTRPTGAGEEP